VISSCRPSKSVCLCNSSGDPYDYGETPDFARA
jgi:hypothetical protein